MNTDLYYRMNDDERLQLIYETENKAESYTHLILSQNTLIDILMNEISQMKEINHCTDRKSFTERRYNEYIKYLTNKYIPDQKYNGNSEADISD